MLLRLRDERGFSMIELLIAMVSTVVVLAALVTILEVTYGQETRITDKVQADQTGRTAMNKIVEELHSSCTGFGAGAIQKPTETPMSPLEATGPANLWFVSAYGNKDSGEPLIEEVTEHDISWTTTGTNSAGQTLGKLTDYAFTSTKGNAKEGWTFPALTAAKASKTTTLASDVIAPEAEEGKIKVATLFHYYKYNTSGELTSLNSSEIGTAAAAKEIAKVTIGFTQAPSSEDTHEGRTASFSDSVVLRFDPSETGSQADNFPCE